ncbi:MAG: TIM-barrel domain-containing protein [Ferruginibacter sp.]
MIHLQHKNFLLKIFKSAAVLVCLLGLTVAGIAQNKDSLSHRVESAEQINPTTVELIFSDKQRLTIDFYGENIFRVFEDTSGNMIRKPESMPPANMLVDNPRRPVGSLTIKDAAKTITISSAKIAVEINKETSLIKILNTTSQKVVLQTLQPVFFSDEKTTVVLKENPEEYFFGGGVQNGRVSHKNNSIAIVNESSWTDGGVASPVPFYWSTNGYGMMWYTFKPGKYDFGSKENGKVVLSHSTNYLDVFFMVNDGAVNLLNDFYQLTGNPVLLPKFAFYEGHLNAYNRDYWKEDSTGILFEDGRRYKESQKNNGGIKESLNGEKNNYQFSARAVIDRYNKNDMPFGWILPNDGYGAGYGQTSTLDSNIANLKSFGDYARKHGVQIGLWTQSDLHPKAGISALLQRDIIKEVRDAGVRVLKTDVAWVGDGYSFGLNGVADVAHILPYYGNDARPFFISLDGWAGTQRYATVWSGDQTGGNWEYIRFHIPTFITAGLSGLPNITCDMDGIFGGENPVVNARDFEWKTFTPMQLNMDGWGANPKYPNALGEPTTSINRTYLKLKSQLLPYTYSIAKETVNGLPMIRAMFLDYPNKYTLGKATDYQFMYGPSFLVAPIYQSTEMDKNGNDIRNNIYLPKGNWADYFSGQEYAGDCIINSFDAPIWKLPVLIKKGAIIPMNNPNNHVNEIDKNLRTYEVYPFGKSSFTQYDDDGVTEAYKNGTGATTLIESTVAGDVATVSVHATKGDFNGFVKQKATIFKINITAKPKSVSVIAGGRTLKVAAVNSVEEFNKNSNVYFYNASPDLNQFATAGGEFAKVKMIKNPQVWVKAAAVDITKTEVTVKINGFVFKPADKLKQHTGRLTVPANVAVADTNKTAYTLKLNWDAVPNADYYEIAFMGMRYTTIKNPYFLFEDLQAETEYSFKVRAVNKEGNSDWATGQAKTKNNPLEFAIRDISAVSTAQDEEGNEISRLFNFDEKDIWHTKYGKKAVPFSFVMDLNTLNELDKFEYLPRSDGGNGTLVKGTVEYSVDKNKWLPAGAFNWKRDNILKTFDFLGQPMARYIKISVEMASGNYGTGQELYVFKVPGTTSILPGDINDDHKIDNNDFTSYMNYTGLRKGDKDFDGYISKGDINKNGLIDGYDISVVASQLNGGVKTADSAAKISGTLQISTAKQSYKKGETVEIIVKGNNLANVNALSFAFPYNQQDFEFTSVQPLKMEAMENLTYDRSHSDGSKVLYPTFVNVGDKSTLNGSEELFIIKLKAKQSVTLNLKLTNGILVNKSLEYISF